MGLKLNNMLNITNFDKTKRFNVITPAGVIGTDSIIEAQTYKRNYGYPYVRMHECTDFQVQPETTIVIPKSKLYGNN